MNVENYTYENTRKLSTLGKITHTTTRKEMSQEYKQQLLTSTYVPGTGQDNYKCFSMDSSKEFFKVHKIGIRLFFFFFR